MARIPLPSGHVVLVDNRDAERVRSRPWRVHKVTDQHVYASSGGSHLLMHRFITGAPKGMRVDHINGNGLDNRRSNLRLCTQRQNLQNRVVASHSKQPFKGIGRNGKGSGRWFARIRVNGVRKTVGSFCTAEEAAHAYDLAAIEAFGEFACLNFPERHPERPYRSALKKICPEPVANGS